MTDKVAEGNTQVNRLTYEVETKGEKMTKELPLVVGVLGEFSGRSGSDAQALKDARFVDITPDNFNAVVSRWNAGISLTPETFSSSGEALASIRLQFECLEDFEPKSLERQIVTALRGVGGQQPEEPVVAELLKATLENETLHRLEGSWHGLAQLVERTGTDPEVKVRVLNLTRAELAADLRSVLGVEESELWKKVYESEFGTYQGEPYGVVLVDFAFTHHRQDITLLESLSIVAARSCCTLVASPAEELFGVACWEDLAQLQAIEATFSSADYVEWRRLRRLDQSSFVGLALPRVRTPDGRGWFSGVYAVGVALMETYSNTCGWAPGRQQRELGAVEIEFSAEQVAELSLSGFLLATSRSAPEMPEVMNFRSLRRANRYHDAEMTRTAEATTHLSYVLTTSQFMRFLVVMSRDIIGSFMEASDCQRWLNHWLQRHVQSDGDAPGSRSFAEASVEIEDVLGDPGRFRIIMHARPCLIRIEITQCTRHEAYVTGIQWLANA